MSRPCELCVYFADDYHGPRCRAGAHAAAERIYLKQPTWICEWWQHVDDAADGEQEVDDG